MHYPDESYVRLYTRKTLTSRMLKWEGRAVMQAMLGGEEFDRAGVFAYVGDPAECIAIVTELPVEIVRVGLERLLKTDTWTLTDAAVVWPNYVDAQTCKRSDKLRQSDSRKRRAATAASGEDARDDGSSRPEPTLVSRPEAAPAPVTPSHTPSHGVTPNHPHPAPVTPSHTPSHGVTPILSLNRSDPISSDPDRAGAQEREISPKLGSEPPPSSRDGQRWKAFPTGWRGWSPQTTAAAVALGLTTADLAGHVAYWTVRDFPGGAVNDLDGELRRALDGIAARKRKPESTAAPSATDAYAWAPTAEHRAFAKARGLALRLAVDAYRAARMPERATSTLRADDDFMRRLRRWADAGGEFPATGKAPRAAAVASPDTRKAVSA